MVVEALLIILVIELFLYLLSVHHRGFSSLISKRKLNIGLFTIMVDLGKVSGISRIRGSIIIKAISLVAVVNVIVLIVVFYWIALPSLFELITKAVTVGELGESPFIPVIPGVTIKGINLLYFLISVVIAIAVHELAHALVAINEGIEVQSWGLGLFLIFPFAYVRISDESFNRSTLISRIRVLAAGVFANTVVALLTLVLMGVLTGMLNQYSAVVIYGFDRSLGEDAPAIVAGLPIPSIINDINGTPIKTLDDLRRFLASVSSKDVVLILNISTFNYLIDGSIIDSLSNPISVSVYKPSHYGRLGIYVTEAYLPTVPRVLYYLTRASFWVYIINISLAIFNAAPLIITDGGRIIDEFFRRYGLHKVGKMLQLVTVIVMVFLLITGILNLI